VSVAANLRELALPSSVDIGSASLHEGSATSLPDGLI
jgi:hypothetical protein